MDRFRQAIMTKFQLEGHDNLPFLASPPKGKRRSGRHPLATELLSELIGVLGLKKGVDIGVRAGRSAEMWLLRNPGIDLHCVDPWVAYNKFSQRRQDKYYAAACALLKPTEAKIMKMTSMEALSHFEDESLDFVHVDGNHDFDYCCPDIIYWSRKLRKGGLMMVHDYCVFWWNGVMKAVDAYTHCHHIDPWYVTRSKTPTAFWEKP